MNKRNKLRIAGAGCALVDYLFSPIHFSDSGFNNYFSKTPGDGGLSPGKLVFTEEFEKFSNLDYTQVRSVLTKGLAPTAVNVGGPSIVSLIHAAQLLQNKAEVVFYGCKGTDDSSAFLDTMIKKTPLKIGHYKVGKGVTPYTDVLSDPDYDNGNGERIFINNIGAAWDFGSDDLDQSFFDSDFVVLGGTGLVPNLHIGLLEVLKKAKETDAITIVNTVYDFLNEKKNPYDRWPLGISDETYQYIDLLICDVEEAFRLSNTNTVEEALQFFKTKKVGAAIVTHGPNPVHFYSNGSIFNEINHAFLPVSEKVRQELKTKGSMGDTTGCGDNFVGGVLASMAFQFLESPNKPLDLIRSIGLGVVSGGFACFYHGGTYYEEAEGQKARMIEDYYQQYLQQVKLSK